MSPLRLSLLTLSLALSLLNCGGSAAESTQSARTNVLQEVFQPATYPALLDSAEGSGELSPADHALLLAFIQQNATAIPAERSLQSLLDGAKGLQHMRTQGLEVRVDKARITSDRKIYGFHLDLVATNATEATIRRARGQIQWLDPEGQVLKTSPTFSIRGDIPPGDSTRDILLETAYYKPTGNELNNAAQKAWRDTLRSMEQGTGAGDPARFRFQLLDLQLANGLSPDRYWLKSADERASVAQESVPETRPMGLLDWAKRNPDWISKLGAGLGEHYLVLTPILTNKGELTHGDYLLFDRIRKVRDFFVKQQKVPGRRINPASRDGELVHFEEIDFWKWPMELRIYAADVE